MLNFTYLIEPGTEDPQVLADVEFYVLVFVLSDEHRDLALRAVGAQWKAAKSAACWIIQRKHLQMAEPGSMLSQLNDALRRAPRAATDDHSFLAWIKREDFAVQAFDRGRLVQLELMITHGDDPAGAEAALREQVTAAIGQMQRRGPAWVPPAISAAAGALFKGVFDFFTNS